METDAFGKAGESKGTGFKQLQKQRQRNAIQRKRKDFHNKGNGKKGKGFKCKGKGSGTSDNCFGCGGSGHRVSQRPTLPTQTVSVMYATEEGNFTDEWNPPSQEGSWGDSSWYDDNSGWDDSEWRECSWAESSLYPSHDPHPRSTADFPSGDADSETVCVFNDTTFHERIFDGHQHVGGYR